MKLLNFLRTEQYVVWSKLPIEEIDRRLATCIDQRKRGIKNLFRKPSSKPYVGNFNNECFKIHRIAGFKDSFFPIISGKFSNYIGGTQVNIKMRVHLSILLFWSFVIILLSTICVGTLIFCIYYWKEIYKEGLSYQIFIPYLLLGLIILFFTNMYRSEINDAKEFMNSLFEYDQENHLLEEKK